MAENDANFSGEELDAVDEGFLREALCVLAGSDAENCSYSRGYVKRQAVFACNTCTPNPEAPAGVCLACANKCHDGHDVFELYTKRSFRCDCGNSLFGGVRCLLDSTKDAENVKNLYNHNFQGSYCSCDARYPDPDGQQDEMIQCVVCEDWYHSGHLGCTATEDEQLLEMICEGCMNRAPFLWTYAAHYAAPPVASAGPAEDERTEVTASNPSVTDTALQAAEHQSKRKRHQEMPCGSDQPSGCRLELLKREEPKKRAEQRQREGEEPKQHAERRPGQGAVFWPYDWRSQLCTCTSCKRSYVAAQVHFLLDPSDSLVAYEARGLQEPFGQRPLLAWTSSMSHVEQLEVVYGVQEMTAAITDFFQQHKEDEMVTEEDVRRCFKQLHEQVQKRRRSDQ